MKIKYFLFLLTIILPRTLFGQIPVEYEMEFKASLPAAFGESGKLFIIETSHSLRPSQPVASGNQLIINHRAGNEFVFYSTQGEVQSVLNNDSVFQFAKSIGMFNNGDFFAISEKGFSRRKMDGSLVYLIDRAPPGHLFYPETTNYWLYNDSLIYSDQENGGTYQVIDGEGNHLTREQIQTFFEREQYSGDAVRYSRDFQETIDAFQAENNVAIVGNQLLTFTPEIYSEYLALIKENITAQIDPRLRDVFPHLDRDKIILLQNGYVVWKYNHSYYLYSPLGELIEQFTINGSNDYPIVLGNDGYWYWLDIDYGRFDLYSFKPHWSDEVLRSE